MMRPPTASGHSIDFEDLQTWCCYCACFACQRMKHKNTKHTSRWCWSEGEVQADAHVHEVKWKEKIVVIKMQSGVRWLRRGYKWMLKEVLLCSNVRGWYKRKRTTTMALAGRISLLDYCLQSDKWLLEERAQLCRDDRRQATIKRASIPHQLQQPFVWQRKWASVRRYLSR